MGGSKMWNKRERFHVKIQIATRLGKALAYLPPTTSHEKARLLLDLCKSVDGVRRPVVTGSGLASFDFEARYRFTAEQIAELLSLIDVPEERFTVGEPGHTHTYSAEFALRCLLAKLASAGTQASIAEDMGVGQARLSEAATAMAEYVLQKYETRLQEPKRFASLFDVSRQILVREGAPDDSATFLLDGKLIRIQKPGPESGAVGEACHETNFYSGHVKDHALNYQALALAQGLVVGLWMSPGSYSDTLAFNVNRIDGALEEANQTWNDHHRPHGAQARVLKTLADGIYRVNDNLMTPVIQNEAANNFYNTPVTWDQIRNFNLALSSVRTRIENVFGVLASQWRWLDKRYSMRLNGAKVHAFTFSSFFFHNALVAMKCSKFSEVMEEATEGYFECLNKP